MQLERRRARIAEGRLLEEALAEGQRSRRLTVGVLDGPELAGPFHQRHRRDLSGAAGPGDEERDGSARGGSGDHVATGGRKLVKAEEHDGNAVGMLAQPVGGETLAPPAIPESLAVQSPFEIPQELQQLRADRVGGGAPRSGEGAGRPAAPPEILEGPGHGAVEPRRAGGVPERAGAARATFGLVQ